MRVELTNVSFGYDGQRMLLEDANVEIFSGEVVALMGPSGIGKSTLLSLMGGLVVPTYGKVSWDRKQPDMRRADLVTWVLQTVNALGHRSTLDNVLLGLYAHGLKWQDALTSARRVLQQVGLGHCSERKANDLSGGELQRMVIARALVGAPSLLLADEPTGQLDHENSKRAIDALVASRAPTTTVVFATHDPFVAGRSDRVLYLRAGRIVEASDGL